MFSFSCKMWLIIKALALLPKELLIKVRSGDWRYILEFLNFAVLMLISYRSTKKFCGGQYH